MFTKVEYCSWIKIHVAHGENALECYGVLSEACSIYPLPYRKVAHYSKNIDTCVHWELGGTSGCTQHRSVIYFWWVGGVSARGSTMDCPKIILRSWCQSLNSVEYNEKETQHKKNCITLSSPSPDRVNKWHRCAVTGEHLDKYHNEGDAFLQRIIATDETWGVAKKAVVRLVSSKNKLNFISE